MRAKQFCTSTTAESRAKIWYMCSFDVICVPESWLDGRTSLDDIKIENFKLFRRDRLGDHHGGICVYVRHNYWIIYTNFCLGHVH